VLILYESYGTHYVQHQQTTYTLSEAWSGVNWADLMAAQGAYGTEFYEWSTRTIVGTMLWTEYRPVIKICPKGALGSHEIRPIHSAPCLGQSIYTYTCQYQNNDFYKYINWRSTYMQCQTAAPDK